MLDGSTARRLDGSTARRLDGSTARRLDGSTAPEAEALEACGCPRPRLFKPTARMLPKAELLCSINALMALKVG